jgi:Tfp pilus assembly protein PilV
VFGLDSNRLKEKGVTLIEALISTVIIGIGFAAVFQMVSYSVQSIDVSGERTKTNYLMSMVAEDIISDKLSEKDGVPLYKYLIAQREVDKKNKTSWRMGKCSDGTTTSGSFNSAEENKIGKWENRFSTKRIKCSGGNTTQATKSLKIYEICLKDCTYENSTDDFKKANGPEKIIIGKMEVNIPTIGTKKDSSGNEVLKTKKKYLYFQIY